MLGFSEQKSADTLCPHSERKQLWLYTVWLKKPKEMFSEIITYIGVSPVALWPYSFLLLASPKVILVPFYWPLYASYQAPAHIAE